MVEYWNYSVGTRQQCLKTFLKNNVLNRVQPI